MAKAKNRYIVDISSHLYLTRVIEADSAEEAEVILDRLWDNQRFLDDLQAEFGRKLRNDLDFGGSLDWDVAYGTDTNPEFTSAWDDKTAANEYLED